MLKKVENIFPRLSATELPLRSSGNENTADPDNFPILGIVHQVIGLFADFLRKAIQAAKVNIAAAELKSNQLFNAQIAAFRDQAEL